MNCGKYSVMAAPLAICATKDCNRLTHYDEDTEFCEGQQYPYCINCLDVQAERARERAEFDYYHPR